MASRLRRLRAATVRVVVGPELRKVAMKQLLDVRQEVLGDLEGLIQDLLRRQDTVLASYDRRVAALANRLLELQERLSPENGTGRSLDGNQILAAHPGVRARHTAGLHGVDRDSPHHVRELLQERGEQLVALLRDHSPVFDLGSGHGDLLALLRVADVPATGVDANPRAVAELRDAGLAARSGDPLVELAGEAPASVGAVTAMGLVEHLEVADVDRLLRTARRLLRHGGLVILGTTYPRSEQSISDFWRDPTRIRPYDAGAIQSLVTQAGLEVVEVHHHPPDGEHYLLVARRP